MKAFAYVRLSSDREGTLSIETQRTQIKRLCKDRGWEITEWFEDNDESAFDGRKRPAYSRMLDRMAEADVIVFARLDRLTRTPTEGFALAEATNEAHVALVSVDKGDTLDTTSADGEFQYGLALGLNRLEVKRLQERTKRGLATARALGHYSGRVPFGWKRVDKKLVPDPKAQKVLRAAARRYVAGESFSAIAKDNKIHWWTEDGEEHEAQMLTGPLSRMLNSDRVQDVMPPKLREELRTALALRHFQRIPTNRQSLLAQIARCGVCGGSMASSSSKVGGQYSSYSCHESHVAIRMSWLDELVTGKVLAAVDSTKLVNEIRSRRKAGKAMTRKVSEVQARIDYVDEHLTAGTITAERHERMNKDLLGQLENAKRGEREADVYLPEEVARNLTDRWVNLDVAVQRNVIRAVLDRVVVKKAKSHAPPDESRVQLVWRIG